MAPIGDVEVDGGGGDDNIWVNFPDNNNSAQPPKFLQPPVVPKKPSTTSPNAADKASGVTVDSLWRDIVSTIDPKPSSPSAGDRANGVPYDNNGKNAPPKPPTKPSDPAIEIKYYDTNKVDFNVSPTGVDPDTINEFEDLVLQEIGGRELLILERHDMVDGINQTYQPIKNLSKYALEYSPTNIDPYPNVAVDFFEGIIFELNDYIPTQEELEAIGETSLVRFDETLNSIIINVKDLLNNQFVEVEFVSFDEVVSDTIEV